MRDPEALALHQRLYRALYTARRTEEEVARLYPSDKIKSPVHLSIGQEAIAAGVCCALRDDDVVFVSYRSHATYLAKGGDLRRMMAELFGKDTGCARGKGGSMHLIDAAHHVMGASAVVATTIPHAAGYAYGLRLQGSDRVVVSFFGDGAVEEGAFHETMNFAALKKLPVLFVCENNRYAVHSHQRDRQPEDNIWKRARSYGMRAERLEEDDVFALHDLTARAVAELRAGVARPWFIECLTYRWKEHVGPSEDFRYGYRVEQEAAPWFARDPVRRCGEGLLPEVRQRIEAEAEAAIADAIAFAEESPVPDESELYTHVFRERAPGAGAR